MTEIYLQFECAHNGFTCHRSGSMDADHVVLGMLIPPGAGVRRKAITIHASCAHTEWLCFTLYKSGGRRAEADPLGLRARIRQGGRDRDRQHVRRVRD